MSKIVKELLANNIDPRRVALLLDVDGCLTRPNIHKLEIWQELVAARITALTGGSVALFSDNDMRLIHPMLPFMPKISEGGAVTMLDRSRDINHVKIHTSTDSQTITAMVAFAVANLKQQGIHSQDHHTDATHKNKNRIIGEAKQTRMGLNWGGKDKNLKKIAVAMGYKALNEFGLSEKFNVVAESFDCVEITPNGFVKPQQINKIIQHPRFKGLDAIMFGDSPIDSMAGEQVAGCVAIGNRMAKAKHIFLRLASPDENWIELGKLCDYYETNSHININRISLPNIYRVA